MSLWMPRQRQLILPPHLRGPGRAQRGFLLNPYRFGGGGGGGGGDPYFANVSLLLHMDGADGSTTFTDSSPNGFSPTVLGNVQIDTAQSKFGGASGLFDGSGDFLRYADDADFQVGSGDFTFELWWRPNATGADSALLMYGQEGAANGNGVGWSIIHNSSNKARFFVFTGTSLSVNLFSTSTMTAGNWYHISATRSGNDYRIFLDGVLEATTTTSSSPNAPASSVLLIGKYQNSPTVNANGWIDDLRITKGVARYTANFTPPTTAFPDS